MRNISVVGRKGKWLLVVVVGMVAAACTNTRACDAGVPQSAPQLEVMIAVRECFINSCSLADIERRVGKTAAFAAMNPNEVQEHSMMLEWISPWSPHQRGSFGIEQSVKFIMWDVSDPDSKGFRLYGLMWGANGEVEIADYYLQLP